MSDYTMMPGRFREAFDRMLLKTNDWRIHRGAEPETDLDGQSITASSFFLLMTKFDRDLMPDKNVVLVQKILGGVREQELAAVAADPSYGNAAKYLARWIDERKTELARREQFRNG